MTTETSEPQPLEAILKSTVGCADSSGTQARPGMPGTIIYKNSQLIPLLMLPLSIMKASFRYEF